MLSKSVGRDVVAALEWMVATRAVLWLVGWLARSILQPFLPIQEPGAPFTDNQALAVWGHWDTRWYLDIARRGYSRELVPETGEANYAFFPLYPLLVAALGRVLGDLYLAGLVISNLALLAAAILLYRLAAEEHGRDVAERSVAYLFLLPTAFVFSGVLTESLFTALNVAAFYAARKGKWGWAGAWGGLAALTRPNGVLLVLPLAWLCFTDRASRQRWPRYLAALALIPAGLLVFAGYLWIVVGDPLAWLRIQRAWYKTLANPMEVILWGFGAPTLQLRVGAWFSLAFLAACFALSRLLGLAYVLVCVLAIVAPLASGWPALYSILRYASTAWPLVIGLAQLRSSPTGHALLMASLGLLQGFLMVFWSNGSRMVM